MDRSQPSFLDFNQPMGLKMNPENRWVKMADLVPWDEFEIKYAQLFPSDTGNVAKPLRMALGALIIQTKFQYADRELVEQITENPYLQYFIGLPGYQEKPPFDASTLVDFRKRISAEMLMEANEYLLGHKDDNDSPASGSSANTKKEPKKENEGTLILDATCAPANIQYPQDVSLLNGARENKKLSFTVSIRHTGCRFQGDTREKPEKIILHLPKVESVQKRRSGERSANSLGMLPETLNVWNSS